MRGINELAKHDTKWREIAFKITWDKTKADDLVQDMYLKLMDKVIHQKIRERIPNTVASEIVTCALVKVCANA